MIVKKKRKPIASGNSSPLPFSLFIMVCGLLPEGVNVRKIREDI